MVTSTRLALRAGCWALAILIGLPALVLQLVAWSGQIELVENLIIWSVSLSMMLGYAGQKVGEPRPQILTVRSDKELDSLKEGLATVKEGLATVKEGLATVQAEVHSIMEILRVAAAGSGGGKILRMPNPKVYQLGVDEGIRRARGGEDEP